MILGIIYFEMGTKNPKIVLDEFDYRLYRRLEGKTVWRCSQYYTLDKNLRCQNKIVTCGRMAYVHENHNHDPKKRNKNPNMLSQTVTIVRQ